MSIKKIFSSLLILSMLMALFSTGVFAKNGKQNQEKIITTFQTNGNYHPNEDIQTDAVMVFPWTLDQATSLVESWSNKGYQIDTMLSISHDWYGDFAAGRYDGGNHEDVIQRDKEGNPIMHQIPGTGYVVPTHEWNEYMYEYAQRSIEAGSNRIVFEEPEFWNHAGYSGAFKREWQDFYDEPWVDPSSSIEASYKSEQLKSYLYKRSVEDVAGKIKQNYPEVEVLVASHTTVNYNNYGIVALNADFYDLENVDGFIGQAWSDTANFPVPYAGKSEQRIFESAYLEYSSFSGLKIDGDGKDLYALADPAADNTNYSWNELEYMYKQTISAQLLQPNIHQFQVLPWSARSFSPAPLNYKSTQMNVFRALENMSGEDFNINAGTEGITMLVSDSITLQNGLGARDGMESIYGPALPLVERGIPLELMPVERVSKETLKDTKVLIMSYDSWKPLKEEYNEAIASWVKKGGLLLYLGGINDYQNVDGWWNENGFNSPQADLWSRLELQVEENTESIVTSEDKVVALTPTDKGTEISGADAIEIPSRFNITSHVLDGAKPLFKVDNQVVAFEERVKAGEVIVFGVEPTYFASSEVSVELIRQLSEYALNKVGSEYIESNTMIAERGDFVTVQTLADKDKIEGEYIDLYYPRLSVVTEMEMLPYSTSLLLDISKTIKPKPSILFANGDVKEKQEEMNQTIYTVEGPSGAWGAARIGSKKRYPQSVQGVTTSGEKVDVHWEWDNKSKTLLIRHWHEPEGIKITVNWSKEKVADSKPTDMIEKTIPFNNQGHDLKYIQEITGPNGATTNQRYIDGTGVMIVKIDMNEFPNSRVFLDLANNFLISASPDGENWTEVLNSYEIYGVDVHDHTNHSKYEIDPVPYTSSEGILYLKMEDQSPQDGWGTSIWGIDFRYIGEIDPLEVYQKPNPPLRIQNDQAQTTSLLVTNRSGQNQTVSIQSQPIQGIKNLVSFVPATEGESNYLVEDSGSGILPGSYRYADADNFFVYKLSVPIGAENVELMLQLENQYEVSFSSDGENWDVVDSEPELITDNSNREKKTYTIDEYLNSKREFFVKIGDSHKSGGHGGLLSKVELKGEINFTNDVTFSTENLELAPNESKVITATIAANADSPSGIFDQPLEFTVGSESQTYLIPIELKMEGALYRALKSESGITADGQISEGEWEDASEMIVSTSSEIVQRFGNVWGSQSSSDDLESRYKIKWDDEYLYLLEQRSDNALQFTESGSQLYLSDATMLFLDMDHDKSGAQYLSGDYAVMFTPSGPDGNPHAFMRQGDDSGIQEYPLPDVTIGATIEENTYIMEVAIPWSTFVDMPITPEKGVQIGMTILSTDNDGPNDWGQIMWAGNGDDQANWGDMKFN